MRYADWKKLLADPVVSRAQEALRMAKAELALDSTWHQDVAHLIIFPNTSRKKTLLLMEDDATRQQRREIAWDVLAEASPEDAIAIVLAEIKSLYTARNT